MASITRQSGRDQKPEAFVEGARVNLRGDRRKEKVTSDRKDKKRGIREKVGLTEIKVVKTSRHGDPKGVFFGKCKVPGWVARDTISPVSSECLSSAPFEGLNFGPAELRCIYLVVTSFARRVNQHAFFPVPSSLFKVIVQSFFGYCRRERVKASRDPRFVIIDWIKDASVVEQLRGLCSGHFAVNTPVYLSSYRYHIPEEQVQSGVSSVTVEKKVYFVGEGNDPECKTTYYTLPNEEVANRAVNGDIDALSERVGSKYASMTPGGIGKKQPKRRKRNVKKSVRSQAINGNNGSDGGKDDVENINGVDYQVIKLACPEHYEQYHGVIQQRVRLVRVSTFDCCYCRCSSEVHVRSMVAPLYLCNSHYVEGLSTRSSQRTLIVSRGECAMCRNGDMGGLRILNVHVNGRCEEVLVGVESLIHYLPVPQGVRVYSDAECTNQLLLSEPLDPNLTEIHLRISIRGGSMRAAGGLPRRNNLGANGRHVPPAGGYMPVAAGVPVVPGVVPMVARPHVGGGGPAQDGLEVSMEYDDMNNRVRVMNDFDNVINRIGHLNGADYATAANVVGAYTGLSNARARQEYAHEILGNTAQQLQFGIHKGAMKSSEELGRIRSNHTGHQWFITQALDETRVHEVFDRYERAKMQDNLLFREINSLPVESRIQLELNRLEVEKEASKRRMVDQAKIDVTQHRVANQNIVIQGGLLQQQMDCITAEGNGYGDADYELAKIDRLYNQRANHYSQTLAMKEQFLVNNLQVMENIAALEHKVEDVRINGKEEKVKVNTLVNQYRYFNYIDPQGGIHVPNADGNIMLPWNGQMILAPLTRFAFGPAPTPAQQQIIDAYNVPLLPYPMLCTDPKIIAKRWETFLFYVMYFTFLLLVIVWVMGIGFFPRKMEDVVGCTTLISGILTLLWWVWRRYRHHQVPALRALQQQYDLFNQSLRPVRLSHLPDTESMDTFQVDLSCLPSMFKMGGIYDSITTDLVERYNYTSHETIFVNPAIYLAALDHSIRGRSATSVLSQTVERHFVGLFAGKVDLDVVQLSVQAAVQTELLTAHARSRYLPDVKVPE